METGLGLVKEAAEQEIEGEEADHHDAAHDFAERASEQSQHGTGTGFTGFACFAAAGKFSDERSEEWAQDDADGGEEDPDECTEPCPGHATPGGSEFFRSEKAGREVDGDREDHEQSEGDEDPGGRALVPEVETVEDGCGEDERGAWQTGKDTSEEANEHDKQGDAEPEDKFPSHGGKLTQERGVTTRKG